MSFHVRTETRPTSNGLDGTFWLLEEPGQCGAEIWPALGCNCVRWYTVHAGAPLDWLWSHPSMLAENRPTRVGVPILCPFPNRIRDGVFTWEGRRYELPRNDSTQRNAIHGWACRYPWRVLANGSDAQSAWLTAEFQASRDAPAELPFWPGDYRLRATYTLTHSQLTLRLELTSLAAGPLPCGLGLHPYFRLPAGPETLVQVPARRCWPLTDNLPSGAPLPVDAAHDLQQPRRYGELQIDAVLTELPSAAELLRLCGRILAPGQPTLEVRADPAYREMVVFTPPHREAICLEPYTCTTDAINLQAQQLDAGLQVLAPGAAPWTVTVAFAVR